MLTTHVTHSEPRSEQSTRQATLETSQVERLPLSDLEKVLPKLACLSQDKTFSAWPMLKSNITRFLQSICDEEKYQPARLSVLITQLQLAKNYLFPHINIDDKIENQDEAPALLESVIAEISDTALYVKLFDEKNKDEIKSNIESELIKFNDFLSMLAKPGLPKEGIAMKSASGCIVENHDITHDTTRENINALLDQARDYFNDKKIAYNAETHLKFYQDALDIYYHVPIEQRSQYKDLAVMCYFYIIVINTHLFDQSINKKNYGDADNSIENMKVNERRLIAIKFDFDKNKKLYFYFVKARVDVALCEIELKQTTLSLLDIDKIDETISAFNAIIAQLNDRKLAMPDADFIDQFIEEVQSSRFLALYYYANEYFKAKKYQEAQKFLNRFPCHHAQQNRYQKLSTLINQALAQQRQSDASPTLDINLLGTSPTLSTSPTLFGMKTNPPADQNPASSDHKRERDKNDTQNETEPTLKNRKTFNNQ